MKDVNSACADSRGGRAGPVFMNPGSKPSQLLEEGSKPHTLVKEQSYSSGS